MNLEYLNLILNDKRSMTSYVITPWLTDSGIDPKKLANTKTTDGFKDWIRADGKNYQILSKGKIDAREIIKSLAETIH